MAYTEFLVTGAVNVRIRVTDLGGGQFQFDVAVVTEGPDYTGVIGELNGVYFNLPDESASFDYDDLSIDGVLKTVIKEDGVNNLGGGINLSGEVIKANGGGFDVGVVIDWTGLSGSDGAVSGSFVLTDGSGTLTPEHFTTDFADQYFGVRLTSVGAPDGPRNGSLKLGGYPGDEIVTDDGDGEGGPTTIALDDTMFVLADEAFNEPGVFDFLDGVDTILFNDLADGSPYTGVVTAVNGSADNLGQVVTGSNGGLMIIYADGRVDFSANGEFDHLGDFETAETAFTYEIEGGATATVFVTVAGTGGIDIG